jgi:hypothetical protein
MPDDSTSPDFGSVFRALVDYCEDNQIRYQLGAEEQSIQFGMVGAVANYMCQWRVSPDEEVVQMRVYYPIMVREPEARQRVAEFIARANHNMMVGSLRIDMDDGEVTYHVPHILGGDMPSSEQIRDLFVTAFTTADRYFPSLMLLLFGGYTASDAVYLAELDYHAENVEEAPSPPTSPQSQAPLPTSPAKKARRPRRDPKQKSTEELPGLFDQKPSSSQKTSDCDSSQDSASG